MKQTIPAENWYRTRPIGDGITFIDEPFIQEYYRCNIWHERGRDRDMLVDSGMGVVSLYLVYQDPDLALSQHMVENIAGQHCVRDLRLQRRLALLQASAFLAKPRHLRPQRLRFFVARPGDFRWFERCRAFQRIADVGRHLIKCRAPFAPREVAHRRRDRGLVLALSTRPHSTSRGQCEDVALPEHSAIICKWADHRHEDHLADRRRTRTDSGRI